MNTKYYFCSKLKNCSVFTKRLILSYNIISIFFIIISVLLYGVSAKQVKKEVNSQNILTFSTSISQLDNSFKSINALSNQIRQNSNLNVLSNYVTEDDSFYRLAFDVQQELKPIVAFDTLLPSSNSFIYLRKNDYIISPFDFQKMDFYYRRTLKYNPEQISDFKSYISKRENWFHLIPINKNEKFLYISPLTNSLSISSQDTNAILCYEFTEDMIKSIFFDLKLYDTGFLIATDRDNNFSLTLANGENYNNIDIKILSNLKYQNNVAKYKDKDSKQTFLITKVQSDYNSYTYFLAQPYDKAYLSTTTYQYKFIFISFLAFILNTFIILIISFYNTKPLDKMNDELHVEKEKILSLTNIVEKNKPVISESYIRKLIEGSFRTQEEFQSIINALNLSNRDVKYQILYIEAQNDSEQTLLITDEQNIIIKNAIKKHFSDTGYIFEPSKQIFITLLAFPKQTTLQEIIEQNKKTFKQMHISLIHENIWTFAGFSLCTNNISEIWKFYQSAKNARQIATNQNYVICDGDYSYTNDVYYYPETLALKLNGFISTGNKQKVCEIFDIIEKENTINRSLSPVQRQYLLADLHSTLFKKRHQLELSCKDDSEKAKLLDTIDHQFQKENSFVVFKSTALELCNFCTVDNGSNALISEIKDYINDNYNDSELCLKKISHEFNISENYFSFLFKKETNENFSVYLERLRMSKAKELVLEPNCNLSELFQKVGYNNATSFRRVFKKTYGVSPKQMKEANNG